MQLQNIFVFSGWNESYIKGYRNLSYKLIAYSSILCSILKFHEILIEIREALNYMGLNLAFYIMCYFL